MEKHYKKILHFLEKAVLIILVLPFISGISYNEVQLKQEVKDLYVVIDSLRSEQSDLLCEMDSTYVLMDQLRDSKYLTEQLYGIRSLFPTVQKNDRYPGTCVFTTPWLKSPKIVEDLYGAIIEIPTPVTVTSAKRYGTNFGNARSKHNLGQALDIRLDQDGQRFMKWLVSEEGTSWREKHGIRFYIESYRTSFKKTLPKEVQDFFMYNKHCTGPHIHLELLRVTS